MMFRLTPRMFCLLVLSCGTIIPQAQGDIPMPLPVEIAYASDPADVYVEALKITDKASTLARRHQYIKAVQMLQRAEELFAGVAKKWPNFRPNLVKQRRQINRDNMNLWQKAAQEQANRNPHPNNNGLVIERPKPSGKPSLKPTIQLPSGYKGVEFSPTEGSSMINKIPSPSIAPGLSSYQAESNYEKVRRLLDKANVENKSLVKVLKQTRKDLDDALSKLAAASAGESVYRDELLKTKKQLDEERNTNTKLLKTLSTRIEQLESQVASLQKEKLAHLDEIATLRQRVGEQEAKLAEVTQQRDKLQKERDQLAALVELNSPEKTKNLLDRNLTLAAQLKDALEKISVLETAKIDSEEQRKTNLRALEETREEVALLKQKLMEIRDENIGYRKRITELNTKLINADVELAKLENKPDNNTPLLEDENKLLRSTIAKQLRILAVQEQSRTLLISTYKRLHQENPETAEIAKLMDNDEIIKLTPAEQEIINAIAKDTNIHAELSTEQKNKIDKLAQSLAAEQKKASQLAKELAKVKQQSQESTKQSSKEKKAHEAALAKSQKALEDKNKEILELTNRINKLQADYQEQARLSAISSNKITPKEEEALNKNMERVVRNKLEIEALAQGASEAFAKNRFVAAEQLYRTLLDIQPNHVPALVNLGTILLRRNKPDDAIQCLHNATKLDSKSAPAWFMLGIAHYRAGYDQSAKLALQETVKLDPANATALLYLGNIDASAEQFSAAIGHYEKALKIQPKSTETLFNLAYTHARMGNKKQAAKCYNKAIQFGALPDSSLESLITGKPAISTTPTVQENTTTEQVEKPLTPPAQVQQNPAPLTEKTKAEEQSTPLPPKPQVKDSPKPAAEPKPKTKQPAPSSSTKETTEKKESQKKVTPEKKEEKPNTPPRRRSRFRIG